MSLAQIDTGAFRPTSAADYLQSVSSALTEKFGPLKAEPDADRASAVVLQFCRRGEPLEV